MPNARPAATAGFGARLATGMAATRAEVESIALSVAQIAQRLAKEGAGIDRAVGAKGGSSGRPSDRSGTIGPLIAASAHYAAADLDAVQKRIAATLARLRALAADGAAI